MPRDNREPPRKEQAEGEEWKEEKNEEKGPLTAKPAGIEKPISKSARQTVNQKARQEKLAELEKPRKGKEEGKLARDARTPRLHIIWQRYSHKLGDGPAADAVVYCAFIAAGGGCREPQSPDPVAKSREKVWIIRGMLLLI